MSSACQRDRRRCARAFPRSDDQATPVPLSPLLRRVHEPAHGQPAAGSRVLRRADIELDPVRHIAARAGRPLDLSAKEFAVLEALMGTRAVLSAEDLLERVWDQYADPFTNTVKVTISRLRKKLGVPPVVETVPRVGYRISDGPAENRYPEP
jgi:DNA-binding response OmpR family regulator